MTTRSPNTEHCSLVHQQLVPFILPDQGTRERLITTANARRLHHNRASVSSASWPQATIMKQQWLRSIGLLLLSTITAVAAIDVTLTRDDPQKCSGMYSKKSWGGKVEPFILVKFLKKEDQNKEIEDPTIGVVIWEWKDSLLLGKPTEMPVDDVGIQF